MGRNLKPRTKYFGWFAACASLFVGSFGDEAAQVTFALNLAHSPQATAQISALLASGLIGGVLAGAIAPLVISTFGVRKVIPTIFAIEATLIALASLVISLPIYLVVAGALGCAGSVLWSTVMVALPEIFVEPPDLERANSVVQAVRNLGYVLGPVFGSLIYAVFHESKALFTLALAMLAVTAIIAISLPAILNSNIGKASDKTKKPTPDIKGLLKTKGIAQAISPLLITVLITSALNVLLIIRIRNDLELSAELYGLIVGSVGVGLVIGPLTIANLAKQIGEASGASIAASIIGLGIAAIGAFAESWALVLSAFVIGVANGAQNALMSSFMMKRICSERRPYQLPAYVLLIQSAVLAGYLSANLAPSTDTGFTLLGIGITAFAVGLIGAIVNRNSIQAPSQ